MTKLFNTCASKIRSVKRNRTKLDKSSLPSLWILSPTASPEFLDGFNTKLDEENWLPGIHFFGTSWRGAIVAIHQLPVTPETLWLRLLGKGGVQKRAIEEVQALAVDSGKTLTLQLSATDANGDSLTYSGNNLPSGAVLDLQKGILTWTPTSSQEGTYTGIQLIASDGNASSTQTFSIVVNHVNHPPVLAPLPIQIGKENSPISFTLKADDIDGNSLIYSAATQLPTGATLDAHTGIFTWTPNFEQAGNYDFQFTATDTTGATDTRDVQVQIANVDRAPSIYISNHAVAVGKTLNFKVVGTDPDNNTTLTYSADNLPIGATLDSTTGQFIWTPTPGQLGNYNLNFTVSDGELAASTQASILVALSPNNPTVNLDLTPSFPATRGQQVIVQTQATGLADITNITATMLRQSDTLSLPFAQVLP